MVACPYRGISDVSVDVALVTFKGSHLLYLLLSDLAVCCANPTVMDVATVTPRTWNRSVSRWDTVLQDPTSHVTFLQ